MCVFYSSSREPPNLSLRGAHHDFVLTLRLLPALGLANVFFVFNSSFRNARFVIQNERSHSVHVTGTNGRSRVLKHIATHRARRADYAWPQRKIRGRFRPNTATLTRCRCGAKSRLHTSHVHHQPGIRHQHGSEDSCSPSKSIHQCLIPTAGLKNPSLREHPR